MTSLSLRITKGQWIRKIEPYLWLLPSLILFCVFIFYPFLQTIYKSLFIVDSLGHINKYVGFENYTYILSDPKFLQAIENTFLFVLLTVPTSKILGLLLALLANKRRKLSLFYETSFAVPMAMASSVTAMIFQLLYVPSLGIINGVTGLNIQWLNNPKIAMVSISLIQIWLSTGYAFIFLLSALRSMPTEVIESAQVEGASFLELLFKIYLPLISPTMFFLVSTDLAYSMMMMSLVNVLTDGGPLNSTMTIIQYVYKQFAATGNYTNANPAAIIAFIMAFFITILTFLWEKKGVFYQ
jgi:sn-glycerol 3-phosphate transport system permease protein